ncbi:Putative two-component sensor histidine kinase (fragment) [Candidatus Promineifilum breve]|uniref:histidine kinase n=1 Tax=Candidatus Promineifilum breve TaxID=1806508 RepID=A0A170PJK3_9CHLR
MSSETAPLPHLDHTGVALNADARFRHVFAEGFDPILLTDYRGRILDGNRQALNFFGIDRRSFPQINIRDLHHPAEPLPDVNKLTGPGSMSFQSRVVAGRIHEGRPRQVTLNVEVRARRLTPGREGTWQWIYHDISSRVELDALREDLIAMLLHDLQSPLGNVISTLELLRMQVDGAQPDEMMLSLLDIASRSSGQLQRLIASLMDINRLEAGQPVGRQSAVPLAQLVAEAYDIEEPSFTRRGVGLESRVPAALPDLFVEPAVISRVLLNLFDNALKYSADGETITVDAHTIGDGMVLVAVSDRGAGIPREFREVIFDKFRRVKSDGSSKGLGLGLAFCRLAVEAHGGRIWVDDAPGGGARFNLTLPQA